jgi:UDP-glucose 4-epimerase
VRVAVTGCTSDFGAVILPRLFDDPEVEEVVGIDLRDPRVAHPKLRFQREDVRSPRIQELLEGCEAVVHLAFVVAEIHDKELTHDINLNGSRNVIEASAAAGAGRLVIASSVSAYGAHADHPDPVTEDAFPRGNPDGYYFYDKAEVEHFVEWWLRRNPDSGLEIALLRPCVICGPHFSNPLIEVLTSRTTIMPRGELGFQLLHEDDLAEAFHLAVKGGLAGPFNVAADERIGPDELAEIHGQALRRVSLPVARAVVETLFRLRLFPVSADWVVTGDPRADSSRLGRAGWRPRFTSREVAHIMLLQNGRPILRSRGELHRREVAEATLAPMTDVVRGWCEAVPGMREGTGGADGFDAMIERAEHAFLPFRSGAVHLEVHPADDAGAPTVVFSPGIGGHARFYSPALGALREQGLNAIGVDRPGHGLSEGYRGDAPVGVALEVLEAVIRYARERFGGPVALAGSSLGGIISWYALTREPDVDAVVCHNVNHPELRHEPAMRAKAPALRALARIAPRFPIPIKQVANFDAVALDPRTLAYFAEEPDRIWCWTVSARTVASFFDFEIQRDWSAVETPTLVLVGGDDAMVTADYTREVLDRSRPPRSELRVMPAAGHLIFHDHLPAAVAQVSEFVREHAAAPAAV